MLTIKKLLDQHEKEIKTITKNLSNKIEIQTTSLCTTLLNQSEALKRKYLELFNRSTPAVILERKHIQLIRVRRSAGGDDGNGDNKMRGRSSASVDLLRQYPHTNDYK